MKYALLIASQRSGTGALGSVLDKNQHIKHLGEIFHPDDLGDLMGTRLLSCLSP